MSDTRSFISDLITTINTATDPETVSNLMVARIMQYFLETLDLKLETVGTDDIENGAVTEDKIATGAVTEDKIGTRAVTEGKIGAGAVSWSKLAAAVQQRITDIEGSLTSLASAVDDLSNADLTAELDSLHEILEFLTGISDDQTLLGMLNDMGKVVHIKAFAPAGISFEQESPNEVDGLMYCTDNNRIIAYKGEGLVRKYYNSWREMYKYGTMSTENLYDLNGVLYVYNGLTLVTDSRISTLWQAPLGQEEPSGNTVTLTPNKFYKFGEVASLSITLGEAISGRYNEYMFQFRSGATATVLTLPQGITWADGDALEPESDMIYQVSIVDGLAVYAGWEAATT